VLLIASIIVVRKFSPIFSWHYTASVTYVFSRFVLFVKCWRHGNIKCSLTLLDASYVEYCFFGVSSYDAEQLAKYKPRPVPSSIIHAPLPTQQFGVELELWVFRFFLFFLILFYEIIYGVDVNKANRIFKEY